VSLEVVTRLAEALHIDIVLVDDPTSSMKSPLSTATAPHPAAAPTAPERSAPQEAETILALRPEDELAAAKAATAVGEFVLYRKQSLGQPRTLVLVVGRGQAASVHPAVRSWSRRAVANTDQRA